MSSLVGSVLSGDPNCSTSSPGGNLVDGLPPLQMLFDVMGAVRVGKARGRRISVPLNCSEHVDAVK